MEEGNCDLKNDWETCYRLLPGVSRTFAIAIAGLNEPLRGAVCVAYLLCRILDTFEDAPGLSSQEQGDLIFPFLANMAAGELPPESWSQKAARALEDAAAPSDIELVAHCREVLRCLWSEDEPTRIATCRWVTEMGWGMVAYSGRMGEQGLKSIPSLASLDRYCYYIAGTVGYLLTDLFFIHSPFINRSLFYLLQQDALDFGLGLQKVNIIKDMGEDFRRGWCFIPGELLTARGLEPKDLADESKGEEVYRAVRPVLLSATHNLERGWRYLTRMPVEEREVRLFLGYSLFFAAKTLALVADKPGRLVIQNEKLKISRLEVSSVVASVNLAVNNPESLEKLWRKTTAPLGGFGPSYAQER
jgi:farnesyl-diphosphate farnesyltransferase